MRLFVAIELPAAARDRLADVVRPLEARYPALRWTPPDRWHVTLRFLGPTRPSDLAPLNASLADVAGSSRAFRPVLAGWGSFPRASRTSVLWVGLHDPDAALAQLAGAVERALSATWGPADHPFMAHVTVARAARPVRLTIAELPALPTAPFTIRALTLMRSSTGRAGPRYETIERHGFPR